MTATLERDLLRAPEVADKLAISTWQVWRLARRGLLLPLKIGRATRWRLAAVERFIESQTAPAAGSTGL
jgi:predicted DNA-binding transcriptional regulator AlpA